jgi:succinate dehydrogenase / fumarate reductase flavoprotein subunit
MELDPKVPSGPIQEKWDKRKFELKLVNPANKRKYDIIVVGSGLAGGAAAASLGELGYNVKCFCYQDSARRAHSIAAQGGINAAKNYQNDGDSVWRLFFDTVKGGDFRSREANVYRLAEVSNNIIDQCVAQGVPFAREYGGLLDNRSFGGAQVSRTFYARGQTGQQLLLGAYQALAKQVGLGTVEMFPRAEMLDVVLIDGHAKGIVVRDMVTGKVTSHAAHAVVLATGGYSRVFFLSTNAMGCNVTAAWRAQVPKQAGESRAANDIAESDRDYYLERLYPSFGNLTPRDIASRRAKEAVDDGRGVGELKNGVYLDFRDSIQRLGKHVITERYGNLFEMYERITGEDPYQVPMRIYPAPHYTMGGLWVDYNLESTVPGLFVLGEANFSDHGANRLGASALMQGLADGYFVIPYTVADYLARVGPAKTDPEHAAFGDVEREVMGRTAMLLNAGGTRTVDSFHRELGKIVWNHCGMTRNRQGLQRALKDIPVLRERFWKEVRVPGSGEDFNQSLEKAARVADFMELAELMCRDALYREESCGGHFREESQTEEGEAKRNDEQFTHVAAWEWTGPDSEHQLHQEPLDFEYVPLSQRSYR